jgi:prepilin-type N-terminal cleavage/methylation domain-containing protein
MKNKYGFTLFELMVVIAIILIVAAIAFPSFIGWRDKAKLRDAVSQLRGDFEMARLNAIKENEFVAVLFNSDAYTVFVDDGGGDSLKAGNWLIDGSEKIISNRQLPSGVTIDLTDGNMFSNNRTRFNARGRITNLGAIRVIAASGNEKTIDMNNRFGLIKIN